MHLLFVCTGNTCRSPMAAFLTLAKAQARQLDWSAESAGIYAVPGMPMTPLAADALTRRHVPLQPHAARPLTRELAERADFILTMTAGHAREVKDRFPDLAHKVHELGRFVAGVDDPAAASYDIVDPFGGSAEAYEACAAQLETLVERLIDKLLAQADAPASGLADAPASGQANGGKPGDTQPPRPETAEQPHSGVAGPDTPDAADAPPADADGDVEEEDGK